MSLDLGRPRRAIARGAAGLVRPLGLVAVGIAWSAPFLALCFVETTPRTASHPLIAGLLAPAEYPLLLISPLLVIAGIVLVARMPRPASPPSRAAVVCVLVIGAIVVLALVIAETTLFAYVSTVYLLAVVIPLGGAALTVGSFWRRSRLLAVGWLAVWVSLIVLFRLGVSTRDDEFMSGMVALCAIVAWGTAALITGFLASSLEAGPVRKKSSEPGLSGAQRVVPR